MAAMSAVLHELLAPGDVLVAPSDAYPGIRQLAAEELARREVETRLVPTDESAIREAMDGAAVVWVETPSNPELAVIDIAALARDTSGPGATLVIDNTLATPLGQRPLELGADVSFCSGSKMLTGHSDLVLGHVATRDAAIAERVRAHRGRTGSIAGPFEVWLAHRSLATLGVRMERQNANALALAGALREAGVAGVRYPDGDAVAQRQMQGGFGPVVCFELDDEPAAERFLAAAQLVADATSFGGVHASAERRARWGTDAISPGFIRLSCGVEDTGDLIADVLAAISSAASR
jgi:cystathionine gamma-lyase